MADSLSEQDPLVLYLYVGWTRQHKADVMVPHHSDHPPWDVNHAIWTIYVSMRSFCELLGAAKIFVTAQIVHANGLFVQ